MTVANSFFMQFFHNYIKHIPHSSGFELTHSYTSTPESKSMVLLSDIKHNNDENEFPLMLKTEHNFPSKLI